MENPYRQLPSLDRLLGHPRLEPVIARFGRVSVRDGGRQLLDEVRQEIAQGAAPPREEELAERLAARLEADLAPTLTPVINATGVIIHTNLGRAPLSQAAREAMQEVAQGYSNLEYDLKAGRRGSRYTHAERLLCALTGAEAALVVNNNAAAVTLVLRHVAAGREVIISRGELVEIGGGFRIPDILRQSGATLVEVGTTNRTRVGDYRTAITENTGALLKVHRSNFKLIGFTESVDVAQLVALAREHTPALPVLNDLGSGTLLDTRPFGLAYEPTVQESVAAGVDITTFSGDKLLGGPQAGIIVGRRELVEGLKREPLTRALRVDKITLAALQATLLAYLREKAVEEIPVWQMIAAEPQALAERAQSWADRLSRAGIDAEIRPGESAVGGGSLPGQTLPTHVLALPVAHPEQVAAALRGQTPPVIARIEEDEVVLDPRTVLPEEEDALLRALVEVGRDQA
ncbi:MAG: L-seryl-tRNA(Sec) selenium transferase [Caldilineae bacterium]|nr:MAG: L-seryl-tRNA(Sec) selenium transferase [Caldilineae bacterium]